MSILSLPVHLSGVETQLRRIADALEALCAAQGIDLAAAKEPPVPATISYSDERKDREREVLEDLGFTEEMLDEFLEKERENQ